MRTVPSSQTDAEQSEQTEAENDLFARLIEFLTDAAGLYADITVKLHRPVPTELMECVKATIESPGFRFTGPLAEAIGHCGTATVSVQAELLPGDGR